MTLYIGTGGMADKDLESVMSSVRRWREKYERDPIGYKSYQESGWLKPKLPEGWRVNGATLINKEGNQSVMLDGVPSQCGMVIAHNIQFTSPEFLKQLEEIVKSMTYSSIQVTLNRGQMNGSAGKLFKEAGYEVKHTWMNKRSENTNYVLIKNL